MAEIWISTNNFIFDQFQHIDISLSELADLDYNNWYLVVSNHQTWMDIVILQRIFNRRIPMLKFFIKQELIWVPFLGVAWWALDFPIMKRYSREFLAKNPHLRGKDLETTLKSCEKFKFTPVSVLNFLEGTRYTPVKHKSQKSPFNNLLRPKAGGAAMVLDSLQDQMTGLLDVTIVYPQGAKQPWDFLCSPVNKVIVETELIPMSDELQYTSRGSNGEKATLKNRIYDIWQEKDKKISRILSDYNPETPGPENI